MVLVETQTDYAFFIHVCIVYIDFTLTVDQALSNFEYFVKKRKWKTHRKQKNSSITIGITSIKYLSVYRVSRVIVNRNHHSAQTTVYNQRTDVIQ